MSAGGTTRQVSQFLREARGGGAPVALDRALPRVYDELKIVAEQHLRRERPGHTLTPTALVHEAYLKLAGSPPVEWRDRAHLLALATRVMRQVLVSHARHRKAAKRGGDWVRTTLSGRPAPRTADLEEILALDEALEHLDARQQEVVEMRFFGGMTEEEIGEVLGVSARTVRREWTKARAWLYQELYPEG